MRAHRLRQARRAASLRVVSVAGVTLISARSAGAPGSACFGRRAPPQPAPGVTGRGGSPPAPRRARQRGWPAGRHAARRTWAADALALPDQAKQDVLGADVVVVQLQRLAERRARATFFAPRGERDVPARRPPFPSAADDRRDFVPGARQRQVEAGEYAGEPTRRSRPGARAGCARCRCSCGSAALLLLAPVLRRAGRGHRNRSNMKPERPSMLFHLVNTMLLIGTTGVCRLDVRRDSGREAGWSWSGRIGSTTGSSSLS